jgi:quinol monooxygenase YgiN
VIALVWQFEVQEGQNDAFESFYGADGAWTALSRRSRSFLGSSFLQDLARPERYLLVEYWSEMVVYERHYADFQDEVAELEHRREAIVKNVQPLGLFDALDVPERSGPTWSQRTGRE